jgi:hypothetical protein
MLHADVCYVASVMDEAVLLLLKEISRCYLSRNAEKETHQNIKFENNSNFLFTEAKFLIYAYFYYRLLIVSDGYCLSVPAGNPPPGVGDRLRLYDQQSWQEVAADSCQIK